MSQINHLTEQDLIEHHYGESSDGPNQHLHLATCSACSAQYAAFVQDMNSASAELEPQSPPLRGSDYGELVWQTLRPKLPAEPANHPRRSPDWFRSLFSPRLRLGFTFATVVAALVAAAFFAGRLWEQSHGPRIFAGPPAVASPGNTGTPKTANPAVHETVRQPQNPPRPVIVFVLGDHLDRSERLLVELNHPDEAAVDPALRATARELLSANRVYRHSAAQTGNESQELPGAQSLGIALKSLERVLTEVANDPGSMSPSEIAALEKRLNTDSLLFEIRVLRSHAPQSSQPGGTTPGPAARKGRTT